MDALRAYEIIKLIPKSSNAKEVSLKSPNLLNFEMK